MFKILQTKYILLLISIIFITQKVQSQQLSEWENPLYIENVPLLWQHISQDDDNLSERLFLKTAFEALNEPYESRLKPIDLDSTLIRFLYLDDRSFMGTRIECIHKTTGQLLWKNYFGYPIDNRLEMARLYFIDDDGHLVVYSQKQRSPFNNTFLYSGGEDFIITKRVFRVDTGQQIESLIPDENDVTLPDTKFYRLFNHSMLYKHKEAVIVWESEIKPDTSRLVFEHHSMITDAKLSTEESIFSFYQNVNNPNDYFIYQISDTSYIYSEFDYDANEMLFHFINPKFEVSKVVRSEPIKDYIDFHFEVLNYDIKTGKIYVRNAEIIEEFFPWKYSIVVLDTLGIIHKEVAIDTKYRNNFSILDLKAEKLEMIASWHSSSDNKTYIDVLVENEVGQLELKNSFAMGPERRIFFLNHAIKFGKEILMFGDDIKYGLDNKRIDAAQIVFSTNMSDIGLSSNVSDLVGKDVTIFPNPTSNTINIDSNEVLNWTMFDMNGILMLKGSSSQIDMTSYPKGSYILKIGDKDNYVSKTIIKVE